jgi:hypothetical protein
MTISLVSYSVCESLYDIAPSLRLLVPNSLSVCHHSFCLRGENFRMCPVLYSAGMQASNSPFFRLGVGWLLHSVSIARWKTRLLASRLPIREFLRGPDRMSPASSSDPAAGCHARSHTITSPAQWRNGTARRVNRPRAAVKFCRESPSSWVRLFRCPRLPTNRCRSPYRPSIAAFSFHNLFPVRQPWYWTLRA